MSRFGNAFLTGVLALLVVSLSFGVGWAAGEKDLAVDASARGKALAERVCSSCHLVSDNQTKAVADVPSFREIANQPDQSAGSIMARIAIPKHPMPVIPITKHELEDIADYIMSLRTD